MIQEKIKKIITRPMVTVNQGTTLLNAVKLMASQGIGSVIIVDNQGKPIGIFTERDLLMAIARGESTNVAIEKIATVGKLITVNEEDSVGKAAKLMHENNIRHLVVLNHDGGAVGVISIRDIISEKHLLSAISSEPGEEWVGGD